MIHILARQKYSAFLLTSDLLSTVPVGNAEAVTLDKGSTVIGGVGVKESWALTSVARTLNIRQDTETFIAIPSRRDFGRKQLAGLYTYSTAL